MMRRAQVADRRQRCFDFGSRQAAIPLAPRRLAKPSPSFLEMSQFVRSVRANGREALEQLRAMTEFALADHARIASLEITEADLVCAAARLLPAEKPVITDDDLPW